jgi:hypothetical protein
MGIDELSNKRGYGVLAHHASVDSFRKDPGTATRPYANAIVVNCGWVSRRCSDNTGDMSGNVKIPPAHIL